MLQDDSTIRVRSRGRRGRCVYCHADDGALGYCQGCGAGTHAECLAAHGCCPTRGCSKSRATVGEQALIDRARRRRTRREERRQSRVPASVNDRILGVLRSLAYLAVYCALFTLTAFNVLFFGLMVLVCFVNIAEPAAMIAVIFCAGLLLASFLAARWSGGKVLETLSEFGEPHRPVRRPRRRPGRT